MLSNEKYDAGVEYSPRVLYQEFIYKSLSLAFLA
jgi:hypothetical protein